MRMPEKPRILRLRYTKLGRHYHCRVFSGYENYTFAKLGEIVIDEDDFTDFISGNFQLQLKSEEEA